jgi:pimeloyl-ACP methyl ester carboxylesterase
VANDPITTTVTYKTHDGLTLVADIGGTLGAPTIIFMHGGGQTRHSWLGATQSLINAGYRIIRYDARGHGESDWSPDGDYSLATRARDLAVITENILGKVALVGASLGGATAMEAISTGYRPAALSLVDIVPRPDPRGVARIRKFMLANPDGFATLDEAADAVAAYNPNRARPPDQEGLLKNLRLREDKRFYWHWDPDILSVDPARQVAEFERTVRGLTTAQGIPVQLVRGLKSDVVSEDGIEEFRRAMPSLEIFEVADAGHMVAGDRNDAFTAGVIEFLQRHVPTQRESGGITL